MNDTPESQTLHEDPDSLTPEGTQASRAESMPSAPADIVPPLAGLIVAIQAGLARGASPELRAAGATACRSVLTILEAKPGQPLIAALPLASPVSSIAGLLSQPGVLAKLAAMTREQLLDLVKQTTAAMTASRPGPTSGAPRFHLIQLPQVRPPGGTR